MTLLSENTVSTAYSLAAYVITPNVRKDKEYVLDGDPTEGALVAAAMKAGISHENIKESLKY